MRTSERQEEVDDWTFAATEAATRGVKNLTHGFLMGATLDFEDAARYGRLAVEARELAAPTSGTKREDT